MSLTASTTPDDHARCYRALIACCDSDKEALDTVLAEVMTDPTGTPGLLFALLTFTTDLGERVADDFRDQLRAGLLALQAEQ